MKIRYLRAYNVRMYETYEVEVPDDNEKLIEQANDLAQWGGLVDWSFGDLDEYVGVHGTQVGESETGVCDDDNLSASVVIVEDPVI